MGTETRVFAKGNHQNRRGVVAVEFAVILPILIMLLMGMIECGRMIMVQQIIVNASREAARHATLDGATEASTMAMASDYLNNAGINGAQVVVTPTPDSLTSGDPVSVDVSVNFSAVSWLPSPFFFGQNSLTASSVMLRE